MLNKSTILGVSSRVTDATPQSGLMVEGEAPAMAMGSLYQTIGDSISRATNNAVFSQQQADLTYQAASTAGLTNLLELIP